MEKRTGLRRLSIAGLVVFTMIILTLFVRQGLIASNARDQVSHTYRVREQIDLIYLRIKDLEVGQRGFVLTGDSAYLEPYVLALQGKPDSRVESGRRPVFEETRILKNLVADNPAQSTRAEALEALVSERVRYADSVIAIRNREGLMSAANVAKLGHGKALVTSTRDLVDRMLDVEETLLAQRLQAESDRARANSILLYLTTGGFYVVVLLAFWFASRQSQQRRRAQKDLADSTALLKAMVDSAPYAILAADEEGRMSVINRAAENMLGRKAGDYLGKPAADFMGLMIAPESIRDRSKRLESLYGRPFEGPEIFLTSHPDDPPHGLDLQFTRHDGSRFPVVMSASPIHDGKGRQLGAVAMASDVSILRRLEDEIRQSSALLNSVINSTDQAIIAVDLQGILILYNPAAEKMEGYDASEFLGRHTSYNTRKTMLRKEIEARAGRLREFYGREPEDVEVFTLSLPEDPPGGIVWTFVRKGGQRYPVSMSVSPMRDTKGEIIGYMAVIRDITEQHRLESNLRRSNALLNAVIHGTDYAVFVADADGILRIFSKGAERMLGYKAENLVGKPVVDATQPVFVPEELAARAKRLHQKYGRPPVGIEIFNLPLEEDGPYGQEWTNIRADGTTLTAAVSVWELKDEAGNPQGSVAIARDITRIKTLEHDLQESSARLQAVIDGIDYAIFAADEKGVLRLVNQGTERILGYPMKDMLGRPVSEMARRFASAEELRMRASRLFKHYGRHVSEMELISLPLPDDGPFGQEWTHLRPDGTRITLAFSVYTLRDEAGHPTGVVALARDITQLKALERMKSEFISTVSHELRTPLTSIRGALGLIAGGAAGALPEGAREMIAIAHRNSERLVHIINDILDIDKVESGKLTLNLEPLDLEAFLKQALEANRPYGQKHGITFVLEEVAPNARVVADSDRLMQVMANLLSNAAKFSPVGAAVRVGATLRENRIRVSVRDDGPGIPESFRSRIFEKFAQAEGTDSRRYEGTGLGLNITRKLVEAMGGSIGFETETGKGTTFRFDLPAADAGSVPEDEGLSPERNRPRILICEDDPDVGTLLRVLLQRAGLEADVARTLAETRKRLAGGNYAALTLDLILPDGSGLTLLRELRREPETRELPVIVISAKAEDGRRELNGDAIGMIDWMAKPIDEQRLAASLRRALDVASGRGTLPRVLHVEDDADFRQVLAQSLQKDAEWVGAATLAEADALLSGGRFDLVVLDLDLPDGSGLTLLERLKSHPGGPVPVLILSASETDNGVRHKVEAALVKSRLSEERIVQTILKQIRKAPAREGRVPT